MEDPIKSKVVNGRKIVTIQKKHGTNMNFKNRKKIGDL